MEVTFFKISKKNNSSAKPTSDGTTLNVTLKEGSGIVKPTLEIHYKGFDFNYCHIDFFGRYYFITNIESIAYDTYVVSLESDVLANFNAIGQEQYVEYSSSNYNTLINDNRIVPVPRKITDKKTIFSMDALSNWNRPTACVSVVGKNGNVGGSNIYAGQSMTGTYNIAQTLINLFSTKEWWEQVLDVVGNFNPLDYITSAWVVPYMIDQCHSVGDVSTVLWETEVAGQGILDPVVIPQQVAVEIPKGTYNDFRNNASFQQYNLYIPLCGTLNISPSDLIGETSILIDYACDCITGNMEVTVVTESSRKVIGSMSSNNRADMPIAWKNGNSNIQNLVLGALKTVAGTGLGSGQVLTEGIAEIGKSLITPPSMTSIGGTGGLTSISACPPLPYLQLVEFASNVEPSNLTEISGRPYYKVSPLGSGYNKTRDASVSLLGATREETEMYNSLLNGGAYL